MNPASEQQGAPRRYLGMSSRAWIALSASAAIVLAFFAGYVAYTDCNGVKQAINMRAAGRHIDSISPAILAKPGYEEIAFHVYTGGCGCILVTGKSPSADAAAALRADIEATRPPVAVLFRIVLQSSEPAPPLTIDPIPAVH